MRFLVDAQLPRVLARWLQQEGHDVVHTLDLPEKNRTKDVIILERANTESRTLVTKDADFQLSFELGKGPPKLLLVATGNISNTELLKLFRQNAAMIFRLLEDYSFIEVNQRTVIVHH